jgi:hypothetical protein
MSTGIQHNTSMKNLTNTTIIYHSVPDWISDDPHISTGAAVADLNNDGWLDLIIADGNDILEGHVNVYYNQGGSFPTKASWQSDDIGYHGHLDIADVNGDGWEDVAVSYLGTGSSIKPIAKLYLNNNGVLSSTPDWQADIAGNAFGIDFGDMNNDGRPDLAVGTGWAYSPQHSYNNYVYLNRDGSLEASPSWISEDRNHYQGVLWVDADNDGWLDLVCTGTGDAVYLYANNKGELEKTTSWESEDGFSQDGIMITAGDVTHDGIIDLFTTDNIQLGGSGLFRRYNGVESGYFEPVYSWEYYGGHGSAVALADVNGDNLLDLATGGWWNPSLLFLNSADGLPSTPSWFSEVTSVIEKIVFGDIGPTLENEEEITEIFTPHGSRQLFYLSHQPIQYIKTIIVNDKELPPSSYTYSREHGWITIQDEQIENLEVTYLYSKSLDMMISNWDNGKGNFLYYNQLSFEDLSAEGNLIFQDIKPSSTIIADITIKNIGAEGSYLDWEIQTHPSWGTWSFTPSSGDNLTPEQGDQIVHIEIIVPNEKNQQFTGDLIIGNKNNMDDTSRIEVTVATCKQKTDWHSLDMTHIYQWFKNNPVINRIIQSIRTI